MEFQVFLMFLNSLKYAQIISQMIIELLYLDR